MASWKFNKLALVPKRHLADFFVENPKDVVQTYDTLYGKIIERDQSKQSITMTTISKLFNTYDYMESVNLVS